MNRDQKLRDIRLIALDLDGTLLNTEKRLSDRSREALARAAAAGIEIVPTTGRFFDGIPEAVRTLPFLRYAITINGAAVFDVRRGENLTKAELPLERALEIMEAVEGLPVLVDCYQDNAGWMSRSMWERVADFVDLPHARKLVRETRRPVPDLKAMLRARGRSVQKLQLIVKDLDLRERLLRELPERFPHLSVTSSWENNVEINDADAHKGRALQSLAERLGLRPDQTMAFGDGLNDVTMLRAAGLGVAMGNACPEALAAANTVTADCDHDGVAAGIARFVFGE